MPFQVSARRVCLAVCCLLAGGGTAHAQLPPFASATLPGSAWAGVVQVPGGLLYGVTYDGGTFGKGTIFKVTRDLATVTVVHHFNGADGYVPYAELTVGTGTAAGKLFGSTSGYPGTLFSFDLATNTLSTLVTFPGAGPFVPVLQIGDYLYGAIGGTGPGGEVFRVRVDGTGYQTLKSFPASAGGGGWEGPDGLGPGALTTGPDGFLYGAAGTGGDASCYPGYGCGTLFRLQPDGSSFSVLHTFTAPAFPGGFPQRKLVVGADGWLYGTTFRAAFRIRPSGTDFSLIYTLPAGAGSQIFSPPVEGTDGRLYITQYDGGPAGAGRVFSIQKDGTGFVGHHEFSFTSGGYGPYGILYRDTAGTLYNTTEYSATAPYPGTVFAIRGTNSAPIAIATAPSPVAAGAGCVASVTLGGSGSSDPDGDPLTYVWKEGGTTLATGATPVVSLPVGLHTITLVVTDPFGAFDTMDVTVEVTGSAAIAYAGPALLQQFGPNTLSATLTVAGVPAAGVLVTFTVNGVALPAAVTDATGTAQLVATIGGSGATATIQVAAPPGGCGGGATDTAVVPVNRWPTLAVSATTPVVAGPTCTAPVTLDATGTSDLDGDALTYVWTEGPATLATTRTATVTMAAGSHNVVLTVSDGRGGTSTTAVGILVAEEPSSVQYTGPVVFASGVPTAATALLRTAAGVPLAGKSVRFTLGGLQSFGTTNASGVATTMVTAGAPGPATLRAEFLGDACHAAAQVDTPVTVTPPTATLIVTKIVVNDGGGTKVPSDFTMLVSGSGPVPASFPGSAAGTTVLLNPGAYAVSELTVVGYAGSLGPGCSGTIAAGETKTCTVTNDDVTLNLQVAALKAPAGVAPGAALTVTDTTVNVGIGVVPATLTRIWLSSDKLVGGGDALLGTRAVPVLAGGAKSAGSTPAVLPALAPGVYYLLAQADATNAVAESSEADNTRSKTLVVGPDLVVTAITTVPAAPVSTAPTTIAVTTRNNGGAASGPTLTRLYRSVNGKVDPTDPVLATFVVPGLAPGASDTQQVTVTLPAGGYNLLGVCDADTAEAEARETNNRRRLALVVP